MEVKTLGDDRYRFCVSDTGAAEGQYLATNLRELSHPYDMEAIREVIQNLKRV